MGLKIETEIRMRPQVCSIESGFVSDRLVVLDIGQYGIARILRIPLLMVKSWKAISLNARIT